MPERLGTSVRSKKPSLQGKGQAAGTLWFGRFPPKQGMALLVGKNGFKRPDVAMP